MDKKKKPTPKKKTGRKSKYETHVQPYLHLIPSWRRDGMTEQELADKLKIHIDTLQEYKKEFSEFSEVIKKGKAEIYAKVQGSFFKGCEGYFVEEVITEITKSPFGTTTKVRKHKRWIPASTANQIFALKNLGKWRDNPEAEKGEKQRVELVCNLPVKRYVPKDGD